MYSAWVNYFTEEVVVVTLEVREDDDLGQLVYYHSELEALDSVYTELQTEIVDLKKRLDSAKRILSKLNTKITLSRSGEDK